MQIEKVKIEELKPYKKNQKKHPKEQIDLLKKNIEKFGFTTPVLIGENNEVIAGHGRLIAIKELEWEEVDCVRVEGLTDDEVKALRIADNKLTEMAKWDLRLVTEELDKLELGLVTLTGFDDRSSGIDNLYTRKIISPTYKPSGSALTPELLVDTKKTDELEKEIKESKVPDDIKSFLLQASKRHLVFNYEEIANFYANTDKETQDLMEKSALVIIDFEKAIENGYVQLSEFINKIRYENKDEK